MLVLEQRFPLLSFDSLQFNIMIEQLKKDFCKTNSVGSENGHVRLKPIYFILALFDCFRILKPNASIS